MRRRFATLALSTLLAAGCATPPPVAPSTPVDAPVEPTTPVIAAAPAPGAAADQVLDLTPVKAPGSVVLEAGWRSPEATVASMVGFTSVPQRLVDAEFDEAVREFVEDQFGEDVDARKFAAAIHRGAPIDVALLVDPKDIDKDPIGAMAIGLRSAERAKAAALGGADKLADGIWQINTSEEREARCVIAMANGPAPARLVCSDNIKTAFKLAPYMALTVPKKARPKEDFHITLAGRPLIDALTPQVLPKIREIPTKAKKEHIGNAKHDLALDRASMAIAGELENLMKDADSLSIRVGFDKTKGVSVGYRAKMAGKSSWLVKTLVTSKRGPAPAMFWNLPKIADTAWYGRSGDPKDYAGMLPVLRDLLEARLAHEKFATAADRKAISKMLRVGTSKHTGVVFATGGHGNPASAPAPKKGGNLVQDVIDAAVGWQLTGIEEPAKETRTYLTDLVKLYNRPTFQRMMKKELGSEAFMLPKVRVLPAPRKLGRGALKIVGTAKLPDPKATVSLPPTPPPGAPIRRRKPPKTITVKMTMLLMEDAGRTWLTFGTDEKVLVDLLMKVKGTIPGPASIARRTDLAPLQQNHTTAGFTSFNALVSSLKPAVEAFLTSAPSSVNAPAQKVMNLFGSLPNGGKTPIFFFSETSPNTPPTISGSVHVAPGTLKDVGWFATNVFQIFNAQKP